MTLRLVIETIAILQIFMAYILCLHYSLINVIQLMLLTNTTIATKETLRVGLYDVQK